MDGAALQKLLSQNLPLILKLAALIAAVYFGGQRVKAYRMKHRKDLYKPRLAIYDEVVKFLKITTRGHVVSDEDLYAFVSSTAEANNLFGPKIPKYIGEIYSHALRLNQAKTQYCIETEKNPDYDAGPVTQVEEEEFNWLKAQFSEAKTKFKKYLSISK